MSNVFAQMEAASAPMPAPIPTQSPSLYDIKEAQGFTIARLVKVRIQLSTLEDKLFGARPPSVGDCNVAPCAVPKKGHLLDAYDNAQESQKLADDIHLSLTRILAAL